mmetsp:Transcript_38277/g.62241  ORF Transcript_38277/g.62241 Transcript_38277/m.62241 type:complete len:168 (+) Transcript_38277:620-1123(+)
MCVDDDVVVFGCQAMRSGVNLIDTSPSYGNSGSERMIGDVLRELEKEGISREEIVVSTKVGYIEGNDLEMARSAPPPDYLDMGPDAWHCIHPEFIRRSVDASAERLGTPPDVVLLHSPEFFLTSREGVFKEGGSKRSREELFDAFYDRVEKAFVCLEDLVVNEFKNC